MKKRSIRSIIDLTPLLDVILLLIFAFMINMQGQSDDMNAQYDALEAQNQTLEERVTELEAEVNELAQENEALKSENGGLASKVEELSEQMGYEMLSNDAEKETLEEALEAFSDITGVNDSKLDELLSENEDASEALSGLIDAEDVVLEMYKYNYVTSRFLFVDVELIGSENRVVINSVETQIAISREDSQSDTAKEDKALKIYDEIKDLIDGREGGAEMVMVTLIVRDPEVYQYAYEIAWESLRELELRSSGYRIYKTSYTYTD